MSMTPQPYPLFLAEFDAAGAVYAGRVIGWEPNDEGPSQYLPVVAYGDSGHELVRVATARGVRLFLADTLDAAHTAAWQARTGQHNVE